MVTGRSVGSTPGTDHEGVEIDRGGTRPKPKVIIRGGRTIIELDAETVGRNPLGMKRYAPRANQPVLTANAEQDLANTAPNANADTGTHRREYMRDLMRQRRADQKKGAP